MIWRDFYIERVADHGLLRDGIAAALGLQNKSVAVVLDELDMPNFGEFEAVLILRTCAGDVQHTASVYIFSDKNKVDQIDDCVFAQELADVLGCMILLPDESSINPFIFVKFCPRALPVQVSIDPVRLDRDEAVWIDGGVS